MIEAHEAVFYYLSGVRSVLVGNGRSHSSADPGAWCAENAVTSAREDC